MKLASLGGWFQPTGLKNMLVKMGSSSPRIGVKIKKCLKKPPPSSVLYTLNILPPTPGTLSWLVANMELSVGIFR